MLHLSPVEFKEWNNWDVIVLQNYFITLEWDILLYANLCEKFAKTSKLRVMKTKSNVLALISRVNTF